jgi:hypothetical protein
MVYFSVAASTSQRSGSSRRTTHVVKPLPERVRLSAALGALRGVELEVFGWRTEDGETMLRCRLVDGRVGTIPARWSDLPRASAGPSVLGGVAAVGRTERGAVLAASAAGTSLRRKPRFRCPDSSRSRWARRWSRRRCGRRCRRTASGLGRRVRTGCPIFARVRGCGRGGNGRHRAGPSSREAGMAKTKRRLSEGDRAARRQRERERLRIAPGQLPILEAGSAGCACERGRDSRDRGSQTSCSLRSHERTRCSWPGSRPGCAWDTR